MKITNTTIALGLLVGFGALRAAQKASVTDAPPDWTIYTKAGPVHLAELVSKDGVPPTPEVAANLHRWATLVLAPFAERHGRLLKVHSAHRSREHNASDAVGGAEDSQHVTGDAGDVSDTVFSAGELALELLDILGNKADQVIAYALPNKKAGGRGGHTHVSVAGAGARGELRVGPRGSSREFLATDDRLIDLLIEVPDLHVNTMRARLPPEAFGDAA